MPRSVGDNVHGLKWIIKRLDKASQADRCSDFASQSLLEAERLVQEAISRMMLEKCIESIFKIFRDSAYETSLIKEKMDEHMLGECCANVDYEGMVNDVSTLATTAHNMREASLEGSLEEQALADALCEFFRLCHYMKSDPSSSWKNGASGNKVDAINGLTTLLAAAATDLDKALCGATDTTKVGAIGIVVSTYEKASNKRRRSQR
jgi:hypothetical protein